MCINIPDDNVGLRKLVDQDVQFRFSELVRRYVNRADGNKLLNKIARIATILEGNLEDYIWQGTD